jgi:hypothetical protein
MNFKNQGMWFLIPKRAITIKNTIFQQFLFLNFKINFKPCIVACNQQTWEKKVYSCEEILRKLGLEKWLSWRLLVHLPFLRWFLMLPPKNWFTFQKQHWFNFATLFIPLFFCHQQQQVTPPSTLKQLNWKSKIAYSCNIEVSKKNHFIIFITNLKP